MRFWFDSEFFDTGREIRLISIGIVAEDGREVYAELDDIGQMGIPNKHWLIKNVLPHLAGPKHPWYRIADDIKSFVGLDPEFWAYCGAYDWVALSQLYGPLVDRPESWPFNHFDTNQLPGFRKYAVKPDKPHHALADALALKKSWMAYFDAMPERRVMLPEPPERPTKPASSAIPE